MVDIHLLGLQIMDWEYFSSIVASLKSVERPYFFATGGLHLMSLPSISLNILPDTILGLPLVDCQEKLIVALSTEAPFGQGEETVEDISIRHTWQLSPELFFINNSQWKEQLKPLLNNVKYELGCHPSLIVT